MNNSKENWLSIEMRLYVAKAITKAGREIKCEKCGTFKDLEFHHKKYEGATINDIEILCIKCHRNAKSVKENRRSRLSTIFKKGKRFCIVNNSQFPY